MSTYYNEIDKYCAEWLRTLIMVGLIPDGDVDERDVRDVRPSDLTRYTQCHFFAGLGGWAHALRLAGWPDDRPVWTGSCPCQPFSVAGLGGGIDDERHLWPYWHHLISERRPRVIFGEQVASTPGLAWLDLVHADMEGEGYAFAAVDLCAASVGAPHIRQRLWFTSRLGDDDDARLEGHARHGDDGSESRRLETQPGRPTAAAGGSGGMADTDAGRLRVHGNAPEDERTVGIAHAGIDGEDSSRPRPTDGYWRAADWLICKDEKWRPVEPTTFPLVNGTTARVGRLRAYGNAIVPQVAAEVIGAYMEIQDEIR